MAAGRFRPAASPANLDFGTQIRLPRCSVSGTQLLLQAKSVCIRNFRCKMGRLVKDATLAGIYLHNQLHCDQSGRCSCHVNQWQEIQAHEVGQKTPDPKYG